MTTMILIDLLLPLLFWMLLTVSTVTSTSSPTMQPCVDCCGDGICDISSGESCSSCPADCVGNSDDIYCSSVDVGAVGWSTVYDDRAGIMFDVDVVTEDEIIYIYELSIYLINYNLDVTTTPTTTTNTMSVYTKEGTHVGSETTPSDWHLLVDSVDIVGVDSNVFFARGEARAFTIPILPEFYIPSSSSNNSTSSKQAFYVTAEESSDVYVVESTTSGTSADTVSVENEDIVVYDGVRVAYDFNGASTSYSVFKGSISYGYGAIGDPPTTSPSVTFSPSGSTTTLPPTTPPTMMPSFLVRINLRNSQFERESLRWKVIAGNPQRVCNTGNEYTGDCCYAFTGSSLGEPQRLKNKVVDFPGGGQIGDKYNFYFWLKGENVERKNDFRIYLKLKDDDTNTNNSMLFCKSSKAGTFAYREMKCEYDVARNFDRMEIIFEYLGTNGTVYLDRLSLFQVV